MSASKPRFPLPDSPEANQQGCKCPVPGNGKGEGTLIDGVREFKINPACPLHSDPRAWISGRDYRGAAGAAFVVLWLALSLVGCAAAHAETLPVIPDDTLTPGVVASTDQKLVCATGAQGTYSQQHRVTTTAMKAEVYRRYHVEKRGREFEIDHRLPLALGGKDAIENLWPQEGWQHPSFHDKDRLEAYLWRQVCRKHAMALGEAQKLLLGDWRPAYKQIFGEAP